MNKLTIEIARRDIGHLKEHQANPKVGLTIREEFYLQALEKALPVLEQQENRHQWDSEGERCVKCGDKDWFAGDKCDGRAPQPSTTPQIDNDGWIEWNGGECPLAVNAMVQYKLRNGWIDSCFADDVRWRSASNPREYPEADIIAYRVIENDGREG